GSRAALRQFRAQSRGVLVNVGSALGVVATPLLTAYVASKFAVRGFSDALRMELLNDPDIHVCTVLPASVSTPLWDFAGNYTRRALRPIPPVYTPVHIAGVVVGALEDPKPQLTAGGFGWVMRASRLLPHRVLDPIVARLAQFALGAPGVEPTSGNIVDPPPEDVPRALARAKPVLPSVWKMHR
ncbi:MAG TPA: SDR family NAD(P)-dependent oxidoreductase, partial [Actinomycetota bacterium]|nr:SDR family NAD(P)-dependent oxidoreductase [Actinomycetota bacterium]